MQKITLMSVALAFMLLSACKNGGPEADATGVFEADEVIVSAEVGGRLLRFSPKEGDTLSRGAIAAEIDATNLSLQKARLPCCRNRKRHSVCSLRHCSGNVPDLKNS